MARRGVVCLVLARAARAGAAEQRAELWLGLLRGGAADGSAGFCVTCAVNQCLGRLPLTTGKRLAHAHAQEQVS